MTAVLPVLLAVPREGIRIYQVEDPVAVLGHGVYGGSWVRTIESAVLPGGDLNARVVLAVPEERHQRRIHRVRYRLDRQ